MAPDRTIDARRSFLKSTVAALGVGSLTRSARAAPPDPIDALAQNINTNSKPSDLKITDLRVAVIGGAPMTCPIIRIDTNQGIYGLGEVRDGASKNYALMLKSRLLGQNPCNVDKLFRRIKQFGSHSRQGGGVCGRITPRRSHDDAGMRAAPRSRRLPRSLGYAGCVQDLRSRA